jgi:hypothetical protein
LLLSTCKYHHPAEAAEDCEQEKRGLVRVHKPQVKGTFDPFDEEQTILATIFVPKNLKKAKLNEF